MLSALDRRRSGLAPAVILGALVALVLLVAVARAAASARGEHRALCFLSKMGINIGEGCGSAAKAQAGREIEKLLEQTPRVHDIEVGDAPGGGARRLLEAAAAAGRRGAAWLGRAAGGGGGGGGGGGEARQLRLQRRLVD